jgi:hypothetical protein
MRFCLKFEVQILTSAGLKASFLSTAEDNRGPQSIEDEDANDSYLNIELRRAESLLQDVSSTKIWLGVPQSLKNYQQK